MSIKTCICDLLGDAAEEIERLQNMVDQCDHHEHSLQDALADIERLRAADTELSILRSKLSATTHDCTDRTECALREIVWHLRAIL